LSAIHSGRNTLIQPITHKEEELQQKRLEIEWKRGLPLCKARGDKLEQMEVVLLDNEATKAFPLVILGFARSRWMT